MWLPPYWGSYQHFVHDLVHSPFLGSGQGGIHNPHGLHAIPFAFGPSPVPWTVPFVISVLANREASLAIASGQASRQAVANADHAIADFLNYCGTPCPERPCRGSHSFRPT